jgi:DNA mismatch repair ATPase MutS
MCQWQITNGADGAGLACGVFEYLLSLGDESPKVIAATHFHGRICFMKGILFMI